MNAYITLGLQHILSFQGYDHMLYVAALVAPYLLSQWRKVLGLVTAFTVGHTVSLIISIFYPTLIQNDWLEFCISISIGITAAIGLFHKRESALTYQYALTIAFGLIHGAGFGGYLAQLLAGEDIWKPLLFFNLGVEIGQITIALSVLGLLQISRLISKLALQTTQKLILAVAVIISIFLAVQNFPIP